MVTDILIDRTLSYLERGQREFVDEDSELEELKLLGIVKVEGGWTPAGDMEITVVTEFNPPPSRNFLYPYRSLRDLQKKLDTMTTDAGLEYAKNLLKAARLLSKAALEAEAGQ